MLTKPINISFLNNIIPLGLKYLDTDFMGNLAYGNQLTMNNARVGLVE